MKKILFLFCLGFSVAHAQRKVQVLAFYAGINDKAHVSFVKEANVFFASQSLFNYASTNDWSKMTPDTLAKYDVILFLDTRPEKEEQRLAFQKYMESGGGWLGFHFAAFSLKNSAYDTNWDWYHETFLGSGEYKSNTWRPTQALLKRITKNRIPASNKKINAPANEWYAWKNDLRQNKDIEILYAIDESSFPLGTGPKPHEIWHEGFYPVIWKNKKFNMLYSNIGHNDMDYEHLHNKETVTELSATFANREYADFIIQSILVLGKSK
jgi:hypothetical protein